LVDALLVQYYPYIKDIKEKRGADGVCPRLAVFEACEMLQQIGSSVINPIPRPDLTWYQVAWILSMPTEVQRLLAWRSTFTPIELAAGFG
jgi:hypothetical protein